MVINSPARNGWGETAQALHGEVAQVNSCYSSVLNAVRTLIIIPTFVVCPLLWDLCLQMYWRKKLMLWFQVFRQRSRDVFVSSSTVLSTSRYSQQDRSGLSLDFAILFFLAESWTSYFLFRAFLFSAKLPGFYFLFPTFPNFCRPCRMCARVPWVPLTHQVVAENL